MGFVGLMGLMGRPGLVRRLGRVGRGRVWLWGALLGVLLMVGVAAACGGEEERPVGGVESIALMSSDGLVMHAEVWRGGETWLLLGHMFTANLEAWDSIAEGFQARGYSVLTWDFRGHGQTEDFAHIPQELWAAEIFREWLAALDYAEAEGAEAIYGAGASMGGTSLAVVASLEAAGEERLEGFVLVSAPDGVPGVGRVGELRGRDDPAADHCGGWMIGRRRRSRGCITGRRRGRRRWWSCRRICTGTR